jgi:hypothetical protein
MESVRVNDTVWYPWSIAGWDGPHYVSVLYVSEHTAAIVTAKGYATRVEISELCATRDEAYAIANAFYGGVS